MIQIDTFLQGQISKTDIVKITDEAVWGQNNTLVLILTLSASMGGDIDVEDNEAGDENDVGGDDN